jgi:hypothetical protein
MQLGTRWNLGTEPPSRLSEAVIGGIRKVEADLTDFDTAGWCWTLTWLEGRAVVELDDGTLVREASDGSVTVTELD